MDSDIVYLAGTGAGIYDVQLVKTGKRTFPFMGMTLMMSTGMISKAIQ
ncbi:hypothetical protein P4S72_00615 [Vibrio sp. PP-XX7]